MTSTRTSMRTNTLLSPTGIGATGSMGATGRRRLRYRRRMRFRRRHPTVDPRMAARYDAALHRVRGLEADLARLRAASAAFAPADHAAALRGVHNAIDAELA